MLSIAVIAAALLVAGFALQLCVREPAQHTSTVKGPSHPAMMAGSQLSQSPPVMRASQEAVALVLRVQNADCACENARKFADKTFLVGDAPKLPFKDCTRLDCRCRYERIAERRKTRGDRRITANRREEIRFEMKDDRRSGKDRRQTNNAWKQPI